MPNQARRETRTADEQRADLRRDLIDRWAAFAPSVDQYRWPLERGRWNELVFCLIRQSTRSVLDAEDARRVSQVLDALELIEIPKLAMCITDNSTPDLGAEDYQLGSAILKRSGLSAEQAEAVWLTLAEAAASLQKHHDGKLQRYLRGYGERMLDELEEHFDFSELDEDEVANAFTLWLQNAVNMPLMLAREPVEKTAASHGLSRSDLIDLADELEINLAVVDDMLESVQQAEEASD